MFKKISNKINKTLPIYFPKSRAYTDKLHLAIWNCEIVKDTEIYDIH